MVYQTTSKERLIKTLNHEQPDRPPIFATLTPQTARKLSDFLGFPYEEPIDSLLSTRISHTKLLTHLGNDCVGVAANAPDSAPTTTDSDGIMTNEWGMTFKTCGLYNEFHMYPLDGAQAREDIDNYPFPDPTDTSRYRIAREAVTKYRADYAIVADLETVFFETSWYLVGLEKFLMDMYSGAAYVEPLMDKVLEVNLETGRRLIELGVDVIWAGDDFGTQHGMLISPEKWREIFKPRIKYLFEEFRKADPNIKIAWHSCGSITEIIPDFIEIGLDILNPIQPRTKGMDPEFLKNTYGRDLVFFGGIDLQELLSKGTTEQIGMEVDRLKRILGEDGGYIIAPAHNIQDDTPVENILAFFESAKSCSG